MISSCDYNFTLLHSDRPKLHRVLAILSAKGLNVNENKTSNELSESLSLHICPLKAVSKNKYDQKQSIKYVN